MHSQNNPSFAFDLETQRLANEVGGWSRIDKLGFAAGVLIEIESREVHRFIENDVDTLIKHLTSAEMVVGFNLLRFDYTVLQPYGLEITPQLRERSVDMLDHIYRKLGFRISLDSLAEATLGKEKIANGIQSVRWFKQGEIDKVLDYCERDVEITLDLWEHGKKSGQIYYYDRSARRKSIPVQW